MSKNRGDRQMQKSPKIQNFQKKNKNQNKKTLETIADRQKTCYNTFVNGSS